MLTLISAFPIAFLIWAMTKRNAMPSHLALPLTASIVAVIQLAIFNASPTLLSAQTIAGVLSVLTPISIVTGAILLNRVLVVSGYEKVLSDWLSRISSNPVAQLMIIGWAFAFMLEGASGFGTPAAISAPILVGLGFPALRVAILALVMNSVPVTFGAVGTPIWFGFSGLGLSDTDVQAIAFQAALINGLAAFIVPIVALKFVLGWQSIKENIVFIFLSILSCTLPYILLSNWNYEFPSLVAGAIGLVLSIGLAIRNIGLRKEKIAAPSDSPSIDSQEIKYESKSEVYKALLPFMLLIVILIVTRLPELGLKQRLNDTSVLLSMSINDTTFSVSNALIISVTNIFNSDVDWQYKTLYVPALIPFFIVALICVLVYRLSINNVKQILKETTDRVFLPLISLVGALVMVNLMMMGEENAPMLVLANTLSGLLGENWRYAASFLGALGSFFSGSATVSNLTFGSIQQGIAESAGLPITLVLALQSVGAAMGNMVCINNIIAVSTILNISNKEGYIIKRTILPMLIYGTIAALFAVFL